MSVFKMSNNLFSEDFLKLKLTPNELYVFTYLCSVHSHAHTLLGDLIKVKQATIAKKCNIKTTETVSRCISSLITKGLISRVIKTIKADRNRGTNSYILKKPSNNEVNGFFYVSRNIFGILSARQLRVYLFLAKSYDKKNNDSWNSYNDIARQLNISRQEAIKNVAELLELKVITKSLRKAKNNNRVFVDNHYTIIFFQPHDNEKKCKNFSKINYIKILLNCQAFILLWSILALFFSDGCTFPFHIQKHWNLKNPFT